jgi:hypothetical protein
MNGAFYFRDTEGKIKYYNPETKELEFYDY